MLHPKPVEPPERILLVRLSHLGDVVCAIPLYHTLRAAFPAARIAWATQRENAPLLEPLPGLERVIQLDRSLGLRAVRDFHRELRAYSPDLSIDAQGNWKSAVAAFLSGAPQRLGLDPRNWREPSARHLATHYAPPAAGPHALQHAAALAQHLTGQAPTRKDPAITPSELHNAATELSRRVRGTAPFLLVHLSKPGDPRSWPEARYQELAQASRAAGHETLFLSGPEEADIGRRLAASQPGCSHWIDQRGLRQLAALLTAAAQRGAHFLTCDSGPMHLAAACGLRLTLLAGPQDPRATGPTAWDSDHTILRANHPPTCAPCNLRRCHHPLGPICMSEISADDALDTLENNSRGATTCA
jgi:ADP-heptose:LPS heptosyltransferase